MVFRYMSNDRHCLPELGDNFTLENVYRMSYEKGIDKKPLVGAAHSFNSLFLNLSGFSISVSFVWCII